MADATTGWCHPSLNCFFDVTSAKTDALKEIISVFPQAKILIAAPAGDHRKGFLLFIKSSTQEGRFICYSKGIGCIWCVIIRRSLYLITNVLGSRRPCRRWLHENYAVFNRPWPSRVYLPISLSDLPPLFHATQNTPSFLIQKGWWIETRLRFRTPFIYIYRFYANTRWRIQKIKLFEFI